MAWFYDLKIASKLLVIVLGLTVLALVLNSFAVKELDEMHASAQEIADVWLPGVALLADINTDTSDFRLAQFERIQASTSEQITSAERSLERELQEVQKGLGQYESRPERVATEVRKLAERSRTAAREISGLASNSVKVATRSGQLLEEMVPSIRKTADLVQEVVSASAEQTTGVEQMSAAMLQVDEVTQRNASSAEELASTAEELSAQAEALQQLVSFFRLARQEHTPYPRPPQLTANGHSERAPLAAPPAERRAFQRVA